MADSTDLRGVIDSMLRECILMAEYATITGLSLPEGAAVLLAKIKPDSLDEAVVKDVVELHRALADHVAPATPLSLESSRRWWRRETGRDGAPGVLKFMVVAALVSLVVFVGTQVMSANPFLHVDRELLTQVNLVAAAGLGASFWALFKMHTYIRNVTFDRRYTAVYWIRFLLGLLAGPILGNLLFDAVSAGTGSDSNLGPAAVALLGGYSADAVNRILMRLVDMLGDVVRGDTRELLAVRQAQAEARVATARVRAATELSRAVAGLQVEPGMKSKLDQIVMGLLNERAVVPSGDPRGGSSPVTRDARDKVEPGTEGADLVH